MITSNIIQRVFWLRMGGDTRGSGFAIPWKGHVYMVTAKHLFEGNPVDRFELFYNSAWETASFPFKLASATSTDIAVARMPDTFNPGNEVELSDKGFFLSEDAYILGFPLALYHDSPTVNQNCPIPLVSKGCIASLPGIGAPANGGMFIAGQIDEGFSGGPVVIMRDPKKPQLIGMVSYNLRKKATETFSDGKPILVEHPANLVFCHAISVITDTIEAHFAGK